jgi:hypothetical protein
VFESLATEHGFNMDIKEDGYDLVVNVTASA